MGDWSGGRDGGRSYTFTTVVDGVALRADFELQPSTQYEVQKDFSGGVTAFFELAPAERRELVNKFATDSGRRFWIERFQMTEVPNSDAVMQEFCARLWGCIFYLNSSYALNAPDTCPISNGVFPDILDFRPLQLTKTFWALASAKDGILDG